MFKHPIRNLILLSAASWIAKRSVKRMGGTRKILSSITGRPAAKRSTAKR
ncbi:MAG: hypothetical protein H0W83_01265 [Planctomycetes bacterium]|nr:hypothetical protein [Planctomycetota bacterium]